MINRLSLFLLNCWLASSTMSLTFYKLVAYLGNAVQSDGSGEDFHSIQHDGHNHRVDDGVG
jgi:hypothetical protein